MIEVAGLAVQAADTKRILLIQRYLDPTDPAGGKWEFPGGHLESGESPIEGAIREWKEEVGRYLPEGQVAGSWRKGIYQGFRYVIASEGDMGTERLVENPDDPHGDKIEAVAFFDLKDVKLLPLRKELRKIDWSIFTERDWSIHTADAWHEQMGVSTEKAKPISVRDAGFRGYVDSSYDEHEDLRNHHSFDSDLYDSTAPEMTPEEQSHYDREGEYPDSFHHRHEQAYSHALEKKLHEDTPDHHDDHLAHWIQEHSTTDDFIKSKAHIPLKDVYATQSHVSQFHINRHLNGSAVPWARTQGHNYDEYLGDSHPMFVTHEGRVHCIEGHHRVAAAIQRGDSHIEGWHHNLDDMPVGTSWDGNGGCEDCMAYHNECRMPHEGVMGVDGGKQTFGSTTAAKYDHLRGHFRESRKTAQKSLEDLRHAGYCTDGWNRWQQGKCAHYAAGLTRLDPSLRVGTLDGGSHFFAHDDTHAYDSAGKHPLPYRGVHGHGDPGLDEDLGWYGEPEDSSGPEGPEPHIREAMEHAVRNGILEGRHGPLRTTAAAKHRVLYHGTTWHGGQQIDAHGIRANDMGAVYLTDTPERAEAWARKRAEDNETDAMAAEVHVDPDNISDGARKGEYIHWGHIPVHQVKSIWEVPEERTELDERMFPHEGALHWAWNFNGQPAPEPSNTQKIVHDLGSHEGWKDFVVKHDLGSACDDVAQAVMHTYGHPQVYGLYHHPTKGPEPHSWNEGPHGEVIDAARYSTEAKEDGLHVYPKGHPNHSHYEYLGPDDSAWNDHLDDDDDDDDWLGHEGALHVAKEFADQYSKRLSRWDLDLIEKTSAAPEGYETLYHLTDRHHFTLDPEHAPHDNTFAIQDRSGRKGIYVGDPTTWAAHGYHRPYVAEIHAPEGLATEERWHGEKFLPAEHFDKARVHRVIPYDAHVREEYGSYGPHEEHDGTTFDTGESTEPTRTGTWHDHYPLQYDREGNATGKYRYRGKDVRDFTPEEHTEHLRRLREYMHGAKGHGWNEFNDAHEYVGVPEDEHDDEGMPILRDRDGNRMRRHSGAISVSTRDWTIPEHTASYLDVQAKAKRLRQEGKVEILEVPTKENPYLYGQVEGDHGVYHPLIHREGSKRFQCLCNCTWGSYGEFGPNGDHRAPDSPYRLRMCSHLLALTYEFQSRSMFGKEPHVGNACEWCDTNGGNFNRAHMAYGRGQKAFEGYQVYDPHPVTGKPHEKNDLIGEMFRKAWEGNNPTLSDVDSIHLHNTQNGVGESGVRHYLTRGYEEHSDLYADKNSLSNRHPVVFTTKNAHGQQHNLILTGHHRAAAACLKGEPLKAIRLYDPEHYPELSNHEK